MTPIPYQQALRDAGQLKVRALSLLVEPTPDNRFNAAVLLHEAARAEERAIQAVASPSAVALLASTVERCGLLLDGFDVPGAAQLWGRVLEARRSNTPADWQAIVGRLERSFQREQHRFARDFANARAVRQAETFAPADEKVRENVEREVEALLDAHPGIAHLWWGLFRALWPTRRRARAWRALTRARLLAPDNAVFEMIQLVFAVEMESDPDGFIRAAARRLPNAPAEVCAGVALAELALHRKEPGEERLTRAREAVIAGRVGATGSSLVQRHLLALQLILEELEAGREPGEDVLYRAGLGHLVTTRTRSADVIQLVRQSVQQTADSGLRPAA